MNGYSRVVAPLASVAMLVGTLALAGCSDEASDLTGVASEESVAAAPGGIPGRPSDKPKADPVNDVAKLADGTLEIGPLPVRIPLEATTTLEATASLTGEWTGKGARVTRASGDTTEQIHFDTLDGVLTLEHAIEGAPSPLAIGFHAERGGLQIRVDGNTETKPDKTYDLRVHMKSVAVSDPETGAELPWPTEALGALPNVIHIRGGVFVLANAPARTADDGEIEAADDDDAVPARPLVRPGRFGRMKRGGE